jgi:hypothetical protein
MGAAAAVLPSGPRVREEGEDEFEYAGGQRLGGAFTRGDGQGQVSSVPLCYVSREQMSFCLFSPAVTVAAQHAAIATLSCELLVLSSVKALRSTPLGVVSPQTVSCRIWR